MKSLIVNNKIITTSLFIKNLIELNNDGKYKFIDQNNYITVGVSDVYNFRRCHDYFIESICQFFDQKYENPKLPTKIKRRAYSKQQI